MGCAILQVRVQYSKNSPVELIKKLEECLAENCPAGYAQSQLEVVPLVHLQQQGTNTINVVKVCTYTLHLLLQKQRFFLPYDGDSCWCLPLKPWRLTSSRIKTWLPVSLSVHQRKGHSRSPAQDLVTQTE